MCGAAEVSDLGCDWLFAVSGAVGGRGLTAGSGEEGLAGVLQRHADGPGSERHERKNDHLQRLPALPGRTVESGRREPSQPLWS